MTMRLMRLMFAGAMCVGLLSVGQAQGNDQEILERVHAAIARGDALWREQRYDEAITAIREAAAISERLSYFTSRYHHHLARVLVRTNRNDEALEAYRKAVRWDAEQGELDTTTFPLQIAMEYAILLAQAGREEDAKAMYYYGLRTISSGSLPNRRGEPFPFLVVFDPDPVMQSWPYSVENLTAAALVLTRSKGFREPLERALRMKPDWIVPAMYNVWQDFVDHQERERLAAAMRLARTQEEREWAALYQPVLELTDSMEQLDMFEQVADRLAAIGLERRKNSVVLRRAKENLRNIHHRIAVTRDR
ncbi:MAG: tetratricopeptide repeat protein [Armatimonadota bacterium]